MRGVRPDNVRKKKRKDEFHFPLLLSNFPDGNKKKSAAP